MKVNGVEWVIVRTVSTEFEAELIAGRLRAYEIPAQVVSQVDRTRGLTVGALALAKVFVPAEYAPQALGVLAMPPEDDYPEPDGLDG